MKIGNVIFGIFGRRTISLTHLIIKIDEICEEKKRKIQQVHRIVHAHP